MDFPLWGISFSKGFSFTRDFPLYGMSLSPPPQAGDPKRGIRIFAKATLRLFDMRLPSYFPVGIPFSDPPCVGTMIFLPKLRGAAAEVGLNQRSAEEECLKAGP